MELISKTEAAALGMRRYYTGDPCRRGHISERYVNDGKCIECVVERSAEYKDRRNEINRERRKSDPEYRARVNKRARENQRRRYHEDENIRQRFREYRSRPEVKARKAKQSREWYRANQEIQSHRMRRIRYGVTAEQWEEQMSAQESVCANSACDAEVGVSSALDHCHDTGKPRGILCHRCNMIEGILDKHMDLLNGLIEYRKAGGAWVAGKRVA